MKKVKNISINNLCYFCLLCIIVLGLMMIVGCASGNGDGGGGCPGTVCHDCSASGDCPDLDCAAGEVEYCGHFGFFDDPDLRCAFCGPPDYFD